MSLITAFGGHTPSIPEGVFVDPSARIIGQVELQPGTSVWPGVVLRADSDRIVLGRGSAVLDLALLEAPTGHPVLVEAGALISHQACLHGATVQAGALVGIGAIVLDGATIGSGALVAAGAVVAPKQIVPPRTLVVGQPAKVLRELTDEELARTQAQVAEVADKARQYLAETGQG
ncbi:MAG: gamma carbonic anhydrase family protein [Deltaproteobacteria bacterium]|nr:gamma carbonic anhydrase family protein [Deltaproteobacteria bacterium]